MKGSIGRRAVLLVGFLLWLYRGAARYLAATVRKRRQRDRTQECSLLRWIRLDMATGEPDAAQIS
jgi:hypothetical protein